MEWEGDHVRRRRAGEGRGSVAGEILRRRQAAPPKVAGGERPGSHPSVTHCGTQFVDSVTGLQRAITPRSAFSLRYIMIHAENVIKILW